MAAESLNFLRSNPAWEPLKRHPLVLEPYVAWLKWQCRDLDAFVFVATTGRSGTNTLAALFEHVPGCVSLHEGRPWMTSDYPEESSPDEYFKELFRRKKRVEILRASAGARVFIETNHQFIKNYSQHVVRCFGRRLKVVHLVRDPVSVARSFYAIGSVPGRTDRGRRWLLDPSRADNRLQVSDLLGDDPTFRHDLYRCLWYWYEIEARIRHFRAANPDVAVVDLGTEELNDPSSIARMLERLGLSSLESGVLPRVGLRENLKTEDKGRSMDVTEAAAMNERLREVLINRFGRAAVG
jgi:hypothetical protein